MWAALLDLLFPPQCLGCGEATERETVCADCLRAVPRYDTLFCGRCGARLARGGRVCHRDHPYVLGAAVPYAHPAVKNLIRALKFQNVRRAAAPLADILAEYVRSLPQPLPAGSLVVPVPLGPRRLRTRGYNQAEEIAAAIAPRIGASFLPALARPKNTAPQTDLEFAERTGNMEGAFVVRDPAAVRGRTVILVDDVTTSGSTFRAAAAALKAAGARRIFALAVARA